MPVKTPSTFETATKEEQIQLILASVRSALETAVEIGSTSLESDHYEIDGPGPFREFARSDDRTIIIKYRVGMPSKS